MYRKIDVALRIKYDLNNPRDTYIISDMNKDGVEEIIDGWIRCQGGKEDKSKANELDIYQIDIGVDLSDDTIISSSNCGNKGLEVGIVMQVLGMLDKINIRRMEETGAGVMEL